jgi:hypothetical protein
MSGSKEELDIVVEPVESVAQEPEIKVEKAEEKIPVVAPEDGIETLRRQLEAEKRLRLEAEHRANEAAQQAHSARGEVEDSHLHLINNAISTLRRENDILKSNYRAAMASGDFDSAADIQEGMASNAAKLLQLENGKSSMEAAPRREPPPVYQAPSDPVEAFVATLTPRSADWVRRHPECVHNPRLTRKMIAAHDLVVADDIKADTDEYFSAIESILGISSQRYEAPAESPLSGASSGAQRQSAPPAAPVSRSGTANGTRSNVVRLTPEQREMAQMMGMTDTEYAKNLVELRKAGKIH